MQVMQMRRSLRMAAVVVTALLVAVFSAHTLGHAIGADDGGCGGSGTGGCGTGGDCGGPVSGSLYGVAVTSRHNAWAVGLQPGGSLIEHWNGKSWTQQFASIGWFQSVAATSASN